MNAAVEHLAAFPDVAVVYGDAYSIDSNNTVIGVYPTEDLSLNHLAERGFICQPAAFIRCSAVEAAGMPDPSLRYCMDYALWIRLGRRFRIERIHRFLANSSRPVDLKSFARQEGRFGEIYAVAERSFGRVLPHWRACRAYHRLVDHSWPVARWVLWPDRDLLPNSLGQCLRKQFPLLLDRGAARRVSRGAGS